MRRVTRRFLVPLVWLAVSAVSVTLWLPASRPAIAHGLRLVLGVAELTTVVLLLATAAGVLGRATRRTTFEVSEIVLGRSDYAAPYEVSRIFDGLSASLRPAVWRRLLRGAEPLVLRIAAGDGDRLVRFTVIAVAGTRPVIAARLRSTYPDVQLVPATAEPPRVETLASQRAVDVLRLKKARHWLWALSTTKDYEHSAIESLVTVMHDLGTPSLVELVLRPAPAWLERWSVHGLRGREQRFKAERSWSPWEPGVDSVVAQKQLKGAVEGIGRALFLFELRIVTPRGRLEDARRLASALQETRGDNRLVVRIPRLRRKRFARRVTRASFGPLPSPWTGLLTSSELSALWHLPTLRVKGVPLRRRTSRSVTAAAAISREPHHGILVDEHGPLGLRPEDRRYGWMVLGAPGGGKTAALARHVANVAQETDRALIVVDPKEDFARLCLGLVPSERDVFYLDLGRPRYGLNLLAAHQLAPEVRADMLVACLRELTQEGGLGPRSDMLLRLAATAACVVEDRPAFEHVARLLDVFDRGYRDWVVRELRAHHEVEFVRDYWERVFPALVKTNARFVAEAVAAPQNKLARFLGTPSLSLLTSHPIQLDLERILRERAVLIVNGSKGAVGEDNANLFCALLVMLVQKLLHQQQRKQADQRPRASLVMDEAHNVFTPSFATMLSEGRSAGIDVAAAFQYTGQILDDRVKDGIRSLLQSMSIFRLRQLEDARAAASLAMEVFTDSIGADTDSQRRLRVDPIDIVNQPNYRCTNLWLSGGVPQPAFTASTLPIEDLLRDPQIAARREYHERRQLELGDHPHDRDRFIEPPIVWVAGEPVIVRGRTVWLDLAAWREGPTPAELTRTLVVLHPMLGGFEQGFDCAPSDRSGRRVAAIVPDDPGKPGWMPDGDYALEIRGWCGTNDEPVLWHPARLSDAGWETVIVRLRTPPVRTETT